MERIITSAMRAMSSMRSAALLRMLLLSMLLNALILIGLVIGIYQGLTYFNWFNEWEWLANIGLTLISGFMAYLLFPLLLPLIISFFDTAIADAIERKEYPQLPPQEPPFWPTLMQDVRFTLKVLLINLLVLPLYLLLPVANIVIYFLVNGYLLGTEFFNVVAGRHIDRAEANALRQKHRFTLILAGSTITFCSTIPFLNLVAPMLGVAMMVHYFHSLKPKYRVMLKEKD